MNMFNNSVSSKAGLFLAVGSVLGCAILGYYIRSSADIMKRGVSTLHSVGVAYKNVTATEGSFSISCIASDISDETLESKARNLLSVMQAFLEEMKVKKDEISVTASGVFREGSGSNMRVNKKYVIEIKSADVKFIKELYSVVLNKMSAESAFLYSQVSTPTYTCKDIRQYKTEMLKEAAQNAYDSASGLLGSSKKKIGNIINIRQGYVNDYESYETKNDIVKNLKIVVEYKFELI